GGIYFDRFSNPGTISMYRNGEWNSFQEEGIADITHQPYRDITSVVQDPRDSEHHFATSAGEGVYEFKNKKFVELYTYDNSSIPTIFPGQPSGYNYMRTDGAKYDKNNNLWILGSEVKNTISILKNDNKWINLSYPEIESKPQMEQIMFDKRNWTWLVNSTWKNPVLSCINTNGTLENTKDDQTKFIIDYINQDGKSLGQLSSYCIAEDKNGAIWIGTAKGPFIINNPNKIFDANFYFTQIKVPRNDGSNYADFLLENEQINAICIDGANRKWIGTEKSGAYLLSEDGLETIHHFTKDNSPLFSDKIRAMAINPQTGEVFMGTDKGLISYKSDAPEGEESFSNDIHAYPNPVKSDYNGLITIKGLVKDSDVKITDASGILINVGTSLGGQYTWNGKNRNGKRVASGIYFVLAADSEGKEGIVTKILMIK
ncbi:MAG: two-component regulator propeller domain-containing protein, partial [Bacteroidaceae bacterium]